MASLSRAIDPAELLAQAGWVRSIVHRLVRDEGLAEDMLQDTWVAALQRTSTPEGRGGLRAWLAAVAGNLARRRRRREALRSAVERAAARAERIEGGQEELERMQLQRALVDAVLALEEPYRSAVILRHLDGLPAAEIARRQGCTNELARQRVSRGLAQLRARLASLHGRSAQGCWALVPLLGRGWSEGLLAGGFAVGSKVTLGIAGAALVAVALWIATANDGGRARDERASAAEVAALRRAAGEDLERGDRSPTPLSFHERSPSETAAEINARVQVDLPGDESPATAFQVRARITDSLGRPLAEATLRFVGEAQAPEFQAGGDGSFTAELSRALHVRRALHAACAGYLARDLELDLEPDLSLPFTIELQALPALAGRVFDPDGSPAASPGYVRAFVLDAVTEERHEIGAGLAEDGSYRVEGLPLGRLVSVEARARGFGATRVTQDRALVPDDTAELDLTLVPGAVVTGTALDARTREPVPYASVWLETREPEEGSVHPVTVADEEGRFRLDGADEAVQVQDGTRVVFFQLVAKAPGYVATPSRVYGSHANDEHVYDFEMLLEPAGCSVRVKALLADARPARGAAVWAIDAQGNGFFEEADEDGVHVFESLPAGLFGIWLAYEETARIPVVGLAGIDTVEISRGLHARRVDLELVPGEARSEEIVLHPPGKASLTGRVVDVNGHPVPDFVVRCHLNFELGSLLLASGWDEQRTDAAGRYRFDGQQPGKYEIWASGEGTTLACAQPGQAYVKLETDQEGVVEDLVVGPCLTIEGRVEGGDIELAALRLVARDPVSGAARAETRPSADGTFRFEPLVEQPYEIALVHEGKVLDRATASPASPSGLFLRAR